jgi:parvulin-like peptidyl-prolyl isomerase
MSIVRMRKVFRNKMKIKTGKKHMEIASPAELVFYLIIVIFLMGAFYTFGGPGSRNRGGKGGGTTTRAQSPTIASVNGEKISRDIFDANVQQQSQRGMGDMDLTMMRYVKSSTLNGLIDAFLIRQAASREKIRVSGSDLSKEKDVLVEQMMSSKFPEKRQLRAFLKKQGKTLEEYKAQVREEEFKDTDALREQVSRRKLQDLIESRVAPTEQQVRDSYTEVQASHILIDPKKKVTELQAAAQGKKQVTEAEADAAARKQADELLAQLKGGADFAKLAKEFSADPGSAAKGGDLGYFKQGMMAKEFEDAAFALQPGQLSAVIKTQFGYHIIKVTGRRSTLPADFDAKKAEYTAQVTQQLKSTAWRTYQAQLRKEAKIEITDPELKAYQLLDEGDNAEGIAALQQAISNDPQNLSALWEMAALLETAGKPAEAASLLEKVTLVEEGARSPNVHFKLGELYEKSNDKVKAVAQYKDCFDRASAFTMINMSVNMRLEGKFKELGQTDLAGQVKTWLDDYRKQQAENPMAGLGGMGGGMPIQIPGK